MLNIYSTSADKPLKLNINTSTTLSQASFPSKMTQQLGSFNPKLHLAFKPDSVENDLQVKRLNPFDSEELNTSKKHKISLGNINMLVKYSHEITKGVTEEVQAEDISRPTTSDCSTPQEALEMAPLRTEKPKLYKPEPNYAVGAAKTKPLSSYLSRTGKPSFNKPANNPQETNFRHLPPNMQSNMQSILASNMAKSMQKQYIESQMSSLSNYQQMMQLQLSLMGTSPDYMQSLYQDLQMLQRLQDECQALEQLKTNLFVNNQKPQPHPMYIRRPTPHMAARMMPQANREQRKMNHIGRPCMPVSSEFNVVQGRKMMGQQVNKNLRMSGVQQNGMVGKPSQLTINVVQNKSPSAAVDEKIVGVSEIRRNDSPQQGFVVKNQTQTLQNKTIGNPVKNSEEGEKKTLGHNIKFFGLNKVQVNSEGTQSLVL